MMTLRKPRFSLAANFLSLAATTRGHSIDMVAAPPVPTGGRGYQWCGAGITAAKGNRPRFPVGRVALYALPTCSWSRLMGLERQQRSHAANEPPERRRSG